MHRARHNIALENPAALAQAYLDFLAGSRAGQIG
jgi:hypothetical protein